MALVRDERSSSVCRAVEGALVRAGLEEELNDDGCAVVVVDAVDSWAFQTVRSLTGDGQRILVVAADPAQLNAFSSWTLLGLGATDVVPWAGDGAVGDVRAKIERWREVDRMIASQVVRDRIIGTSSCLMAALRDLVELAVFARSPVLITGETGTGKESAAQIVHQFSDRASRGTLVVVDCTTIVPSLSGSELFGHERGAFTGAVSTRSGAFASANRGSLFLDEVGELPLQLQAELLRAVQEGVYKRVGSDTWQHTQFRLIAATNRDLAAEQEAGHFRRDLFHRLASGVVRMPSLAERQQDIEPLFRHFLAEAFGREPPPLDPAVSMLLTTRGFPGNIRELRQLAARVAARHVGSGPITPGDVPMADRPDPGARLGPVNAAGDRAGGLEVILRELLAEGASLRDLQKRVGDAAVELALCDAGGNLQAAARRLGVTDRALQLRRQLAGSKD